ncbi:MAG: 2-hydroxyacid dehydrogenase [Bacilli bacterium]
MIKICMFDAKPYDEYFFNRFNQDGKFHIDYFEPKLTKETAPLSKGYDVVVGFVNDTIDKGVIDILVQNNIKLLAMRCAGYNNIDFKHAFKKIHVVTVPSYSPNAVAEHAMALLLSLNRKIHKAYTRVRDHNFSLNGLLGFDLFGKTIGVIGTGKIGKIFVKICQGFGANVLAYDPFPNPDLKVDYVDLDTLYQQADIISIHCPLTKANYHLINENSIRKMKKGVYIINTSRGGLIDSEALLKGLRDFQIGGAGLDVFEEEKDFFYEDLSMALMRDEILTQLISLPNVIITSHQAYFTKEALEQIAKTTLSNIEQALVHHKYTNEICYFCEKKGQCEARPTNQPCF